VTDLKKWFNKGLTHYEYLHSMQINKENSLKVLNHFQLEEQDLSLLRSLQNQGLKAIILTADWCGDAMMNVPIFTKLANEALMEPRFLTRDDNLELMDQYLTNGKSRSIPIIIILDKDFNEVAKWGPRSPMVQTEVNRMKEELPEKGSEEYEVAFKSLIQNLTKMFTTNQRWWIDIKQDMIKTLRSIN
jgi:hypothetical protein